MLALGRPRFCACGASRASNAWAASGEHCELFRLGIPRAAWFRAAGAGYAHYACILRPRKVAHLLWAIVRTHVHALAFTSWLKASPLRGIPSCKHRL